MRKNTLNNVHHNNNRDKLMKSDSRARNLRAQI